VIWYEPSSEFPFIKGIVPVVISWFLSPLLAALITLVLFLIVRTFVLRRPNSTKIAFWVLPILMILTFFINLFFILVSRYGSVCANIVCKYTDLHTLCMLAAMPCLPGAAAVVAYACLTAMCLTDGANEA